MPDPAALPALPANDWVDAAAVELVHRDLPATQAVAGAPRVGAAELGRLGGCAIGVWEITPGVSTDIEVDEFFVVLSGEAVVAFDDGTPALHLRPGTIGRLAAGARTRWTVTSTLRKVYLA